MRIARTTEHEQQLRRDVERGRRPGVDIDFVSAAKARELMPFFEPSGTHAVTCAPGDLYLEPGQIPRGYARATAKLGGLLLPNISVTGFGVEGGSVTKMITDRGEIRTPGVVDAAGAWTRLVASVAGAPCRGDRYSPSTAHHTSHSVRWASSTHHAHDRQQRLHPSCRLMVAGYESDPMQFDMANLPPAFSVDDLPLDLSVLRHLINQVVNQFPILREIAVKGHRGGLPTMTPDGERIVGPLSEPLGLYVAGGCCVGGLSISPIIGELLAEWIISGKPPIDLTLLSPARLAVQTTAVGALLEDCRRQYSFQYWKKEYAMRPDR